MLSTEHAVATARAGRGRAVGGKRGWESLTPAEHEVARLAAKGLTSAEVASRLFVSRRTVETHLANLYAKLAIHSRSELRRWIGSGSALVAGPW
jgi:DNA-binding CsgD family transcriptional regulator